MVAGGGAATTPVGTSEEGASSSLGWNKTTARKHQSSQTSSSPAVSRTTIAVVVVLGSFRRLIWQQYHSSGVQCGSIASEIEASGRRRKCVVVGTHTNTQYTDSSLSRFPFFRRATSMDENAAVRGCFPIEKDEREEMSSKPVDRRSKGGEC
ncbi:hypothetical protein LXL04_003654 [Taraxacum kok-saghyz]